MDDSFSDRALAAKDKFGGHVVIGGKNYAQGSSREHAAIAPRYLGQYAVIAKNYARIGWQNLVNFGIVPLEFVNETDYDDVKQSDVLSFKGLTDALRNGDSIRVKNITQDAEYEVTHQMSPRQVKIMLAGGVINYIRQKA